MARWVIVTNGQVLGPFSTPDGAERHRAAWLAGDDAAEVVALSGPVRQVDAATLPVDDAFRRCMSRGPRIGSEGVPFCKEPVGHVGTCRPAVSDGWGQLTWGEPKWPRRPDPPAPRQVLLSACAADGSRMVRAGTLLSADADTVVFATTDGQVETLDRARWQVELAAAVPSAG